MARNRLLSNLLGNRDDAIHRLTVGHVGADHCHVWVKGDEHRAEVRVGLCLEGKEKFCRTLTLSERDSYSAGVEFSGLDAERTYRVEVLFSGSGEKLVRHGEVSTISKERTSLRLLVGSCHFHGWAPGVRDDTHAVRRFRDLADDVDVILHLGDQVYADKPFPAVSEDEFRKAYDRAWASESFRWLLSHKPNYMICSDHEAINDFSVDAQLNTQQRVLLALRGKPSVQMADIVSAGQRVFREYQRRHAPCRFGPEVNYDSFEIGPLRFFLTDQRFERDYSGHQMVSEKQLDLLLQFLTRERDQVCVILSESPFLHPRLDTEQSWAADAFTKQRHQILDHIFREKCERVLFLSGDVHASYQATMELGDTSIGTITLQELVSSPINATLMKTRERFESTLTGQTTSGVPYISRLNEESFLGAKSKYDTMNSNAMIVTIEKGRVRFETHRTRRKDLFPAYRGSFCI